MVWGNIALAAGVGKVARPLYDYCPTFIDIYLSSPALPKNDPEFEEAKKNCQKAGGVPCASTRKQMSEKGRNPNDLVCAI